MQLKRIIPFCVHFYCDAYDNHISFQVETPSINLFLYWTVTSTLRPNSTTAKFFVRNCVCEIQMAALEWFYWISPLFSLLQWVELNSTQICRILCEIFSQSCWDKAPVESGLYVFFTKMNRDKLHNSQILVHTRRATSIHTAWSCPSKGTEKTFWSNQTEQIYHCSLILPNLFA